MSIWRCCRRLTILTMGSCSITQMIHFDSTLQFPDLQKPLLVKNDYISLLPRLGMSYLVQSDLPHTQRKSRDFWNVFILMFSIVYFHLCTWSLLYATFLNTFHYCDYFVNDWDMVTLVQLFPSMQLNLCFCQLLP